LSTTNPTRLALGTRGKFWRSLLENGLKDLERGEYKLRIEDELTWLWMKSHAIHKNNGFVLYFV
jgi:hypothetical protein